MSLNGLDDLKVKEAHETAAAEPGGWFLLKYSSRDEVEILGRGNGGIVEVRNAIAQHEEPTPLFGFLRYRRRNVILKYVPEECSRLVQARVTVHFGAITERFSPYDTSFPISTARELKDSTLSAACSLHTASGSTSSSTSSLRRRRLMEIAEDAEEDKRAKRQSTVPEERPPTAKEPEPSATSATSPISDLHQSPVTSQPAASRYRSVISERSTSPPPPRETYNLDSGPKSPSRSTLEPRKSLQSTRPELYSYSSYTSNGKPKIKLGPRPSLDVGGRPHTSAASHFRPVSTLPPGLKITSKPPKKQDEKFEPQNQPADTPDLTISPPPPQIPSNISYTIPSRPHTSGGRPNTSSGVSMRPLPSPVALNTKPTLMTPEKTRLMKALELRKRKENQAAAATAAKSNPNIPSESEVAEVQTHSHSESNPVHDSITALDDISKGDDSGIAFDTVSAPKTDESDATKSDSYPVSPAGASEDAESTRASSISESTDETVQQRSPLKASSTIQEAQEPSWGPEFEGSHKPQSAVLPLSPAADEQSTFLLPATYIPPAASCCKPSELEHSADFDLNEAVTTIPIENIKSVEQANAETSSDNFLTTVIDKLPSDEKLKGTNDEDNASLATESLPQDPSADGLGASKEMKVPRSKFSIQDLRAEAVAPAIPDEPLPHSPTGGPPAEKSPIGSTFSVDTKESITSLSQKRKRRGLVEPIRTDIDPNQRTIANFDPHLSSDDEFMDELQSAVVQEAMPISVSKSPISPVFPSPKKLSKTKFSRIVSSPIRRQASELKHLEVQNPQPKPEISRSVSASAAYLNRINQQAAVPIAKKVNLGSGISQRIKALERFSSTGAAAGAATGLPTLSPGVKPAFFSVREGTVRQASRSPSIAERANSLNRNTPSPSQSRESSPEALKIRNRSSSVQNRVDAIRASPTLASESHKSRPESISVTARILRDPSQPYPALPEAGKDPIDYKPLDLMQSPLHILHQKAVAEVPKETIQERRLSKERKSFDRPKSAVRERRSSITIIKDLISEGRTSLSERRRSMNLDSSTRSPSIKSPSRPPSTHTTQRPMSISSRLSIPSRDVTNISPPLTSGSTSSTGEEKAEKKSNRASRILRRMSTTLTSSRKTVSHAMSPTVREEFEPPILNGSGSSISPYLTQGSATPSTTNTTVGDVNVQFPDSLLWKRRSMALDSQGFLILLPALTAGGNGKDKGAGATRRFHLSEFRVPAIPDVEMQELPNSVVLDFIDGGGLQVACENRAGQDRILTILQDAHRTWATYGQ